MHAAHIISSRDLPKVLKNGLRYGSQGVRSQEHYVAKANAFLDNHCSAKFAQQGISRQNCLYLYLLFDGMVVDIQDGSLHKFNHWVARQTETVLAATLNPHAAYVSDLNAYDRVIEAMAGNKSSVVCITLAMRYWQTLVPLSDVVTHYELSASGICRRAQAPVQLPSVLSRVEVMVTTDIPPQALMVKDCTS